MHLIMLLLVPVVVGALGLAFRRGITKKVKETAQVTDNYKNSFKEIFVGGIEGRYKDGGMGQMALLIQEANPALSPELYLQVQRVIEAGRNDFMRSQTDLLDKQRRFKTHLETFGGSVFAGFTNMPKEVAGDLKPPRDRDGDGRYTVLDYPVVTSSKTQEVFNTGRDDAPVDVFGK